jgi:methyltransferase-like protein
MVYSEVEIGQANALEALERLDESEISSNKANMVLVRESKLKHKNLVKLEAVTKFQEDNGLSLSEAVEKIARANKIHMNSMGFSVFPSSLIEDTAVYENAIILTEEEFPIYINQNPGSLLSECFSMVINESIATNDTKSFDELIEILDEGILQNIYRNSTQKAVQQSMKDNVANTLGSFGHVIANGVKQGTLQAGENLVNKKAFGFINNKDVVDPSDPRKRISRFEASVRRYVPNQDVSDAITTISKGVTDSISSTAINKLYNLLRSGGTPKDPQEVMNQLQHQAAVMTNRIGNTHDPRTRNVLQRMYDKIKDLKNRLMAKLRGNKNP